MFTDACLDERTVLACRLCAAIELPGTAFGSQDDQVKMLNARDGAQFDNLPTVNSPLSFHTCWATSTALAYTGRTIDTIPCESWPERRWLTSCAANDVAVEVWKSVSELFRWRSDT